MKTLSVTSSSSRSADRPELASAEVTTATKFGFCNWSGETLTATRISDGQAAASIQAVRSTHSPIGWISRASSASGMNLTGETLPNCAFCQRSSASNPFSRPVPASTTG